jgi:hypothetical protein
MDSLVAMGFDPHDCTAALGEAGNDVNAALNLLLAGFKAPAPPATPPPPAQQQQQQPPQAQQLSVIAVVPAGQTMEVDCGGQRMQVVVPQGVQVGNEFVFMAPLAPPPPMARGPDALTLGRQSLKVARESAHRFATSGQGDQSAVVAQYEAALEQLIPLMRTAPNDSALRDEVTAALDAMETIRATPADVPPPLTPNIRGSTPDAGGDRGGGGAGRFRFNSPRLRRPSLEEVPGPPPAAAPPAPQASPPPALQGRWKLIFRQTGGTYKPIDEWRSVNPGDRKAPNFSVLDRMERFKNKQGVFKFKMQWQGCDRDKPQIWSQTSNPLTSKNSVEGYTAIDVPYPLADCRTDQFHGLAAGHPSALLNGQKDDNRWWWAVGSAQHFVGNTIPGPDGQCAKVTELYAYIDAPPVITMDRLLQFDAPAVLREQVHVRTVATFRGQTYEGQVGASLGDVRSALKALADALNAAAGADGASGPPGGGVDSNGNPRWVSPEEIDQMQQPVPSPPSGRRGGGGQSGGGGRTGRRAPSPPSAQQAPNADGVIVGAQGGYVASGANSGAAGGERVPSHATRKPQQKVGPAQKPIAERLPAVPTSDASREPARAALNAVAGARVNPDSQNRKYDIDGYETAVYIDPGRTEVDIVREDKPIPQKEEGNAVMYEVASVFAKLHNVGIVGGERVKEMDHYVASVETPVVRIAGNKAAVELPNRTGGGGRPGENVSDITVLVAKMAADRAKPYPLRSIANQKFELRVQESYRPKPPETRLADFITSHAAILYDLMQVVMAEILKLPKKMKLQLVYMTTIRADTAVAGKGANGYLYVNAMAFQQAGCCEGAGGQPATKDIQPVRVAPAQYYRVLRYWTQRAAIAADLPPPTGLYDSGVWTRFHAHFDAMVARGSAQPEPEDD